LGADVHADKIMFLGCNGQRHNGNNTARFWIGKKTCLVPVQNFCSYLKWFFFVPVSAVWHIRPIKNKAVSVTENLLSALLALSKSSRNLKGV